MKRRAGGVHVFDTSILMVLDGAPSAIPDARARLQQLLEDLADETIAVTAPGLAECFGAFLPDGLTVLDMNMEAAEVASRVRSLMWARAKRSKKSTPKEMVRVDALILATAIAHKATAFYTTDEWFSGVVGELGLPIEVRGLPPLRPVQLPMALEEPGED